jgi:uncharacterized protein
VPEPGLEPGHATSRVVVWRRLDLPGQEWAQLRDEPPHPSLAGSALLVHEGRPWRLDYAVRCDSRWRTQSASVSGWRGRERVLVELTVDGDGRWRLNGAECPAVAGCVDVDFAFSPSTNLLPIRRLSLGVGDAGDVRAAWFRFPGLTLEPLEQRYTRTGATSYRYESRGGTFTGELEVDEAGLVTRYADVWEAVGAA